MKKMGLIAMVPLVMLSLMIPALGQQVYFYGGGSFLGVEIREVEQEDLGEFRLAKAKGVIIRKVVEESPAATAGLEENDVVLEYAEIPVLGVRHFQRLITETPVGRNVDLLVSRNGREMTLTAEIGTRKRSHAGSVFERYNLPELDLEDLKDRSWTFDSDSGSSGFTLLTGRPRLGVSVVTITDQLADHLGVPNSNGLLVMSVDEGSPADKAGIKAGDVITELDGDALERPHHLSRRLKEGDHEIKIYRDGQSMSVTAKIESKKKRTRSSGRRL